MNIIDGILSVFTLGGNLQKVFSKENIKDFLNYMKDRIIDYVEEKDLLGEQKKAKVDELCIKWAQEHFASKNKIIQWIVDNLIIPAIPTITQLIYDCLKRFVNGLTNK